MDERVERKHTSSPTDDRPHADERLNAGSASRRPTEPAGAIVQRRLNAGVAGSPFERTADAVASRVVKSTSAPAPVAAGERSKAPRVLRAASLPVNSDSGAGDDDASGDGSVMIGGRIARAVVSPMTRSATCDVRVQAKPTVIQRVGPPKVAALPKLEDTERLEARLGAVAGKAPGVAELSQLLREWAATLQAQPDDPQTGRVAEIVKTLEQNSLTHVDYRWLAAEAREDEEVREREAANAQKGNLWSKLTPEFAVHLTGREGRVALESSVTGTIMNNLLWGKQYSDDGPIGVFWIALSNAFVGGLSGVVRAHVWEKVVHQSVLVGAEVERLFSQEGRSLEIKVWKETDDGPQQDGTVTIKSLEEWRVFLAQYGTEKPEEWTSQSRMYHRGNVMSELKDRLVPGEKPAGLTPPAKRPPKP